MADKIYNMLRHFGAGVAEHPGHVKPSVTRLRAIAHRNIQEHLCCHVNTEETTLHKKCMLVPSVGKMTTAYLTHHFFLTFTDVGPSL